jgi:CelD/BcsL family acetyltransferase involved in cellulose biosynthesis
MAASRLHVIPPPPLEALARPAIDPAPFPLAVPHRLLADAAAALPAAALAAGLAAGDTLLVPHALHPRQADALRAAGLDLVAHPGLWPDEGPADALDALVAPGVRGLLLVHHLGFPQDGRRWRAWCDERELRLVEDASHALLAWTPSGPAGSHGHAAAFRLGPALGLPGAVVVVEGEEESEPADDPRRRMTAELLRRRADPVLQGRRLGHFLLLADAVDGQVAGAFRSPGEGAAPLVLPIEPSDRAATARRLRDAGIEAVDPWPGREPGVLGLPVHHELTSGDLERIASAVRPSRRRTAPVVEPLGGLAEAEETWRALADASGNLFATYEWARAWVDHLGDEDGLRLYGVRDGDRGIVALLPLTVARRGPLTVARLVGRGPADRLGPICAPEDRALAARALPAALDRIGADVFLGETMPREDGWSGLLGATSLGGQPSPVLAVHGLTWDAFLAARSRNFREQARRRERSLRKKHDVVLRMADEQTLDADLTTLFRLHEARWEGTTSTFDGPTGDFHRAFARLALERGWLRLWVLEADGAPVAAWEGFRFAGIEWYYQSGRDPDWERQSVGFVLLAHTVREAMDDGVAEYRLLRGGEEYKGRFSTHDPGLENVALSRTALGRSAVLAADGVLRLPPRWRQAARRFTG